MATAATRVLLVEDDRLYAQYVRDILRDAAPSIEVTTAERLREAQALVRAQTFDLILLDLTLPDAVMLEGLQELHAEFRELPVVVLTGVADETLAVRAVREGAQDYLLKGATDGPQLARAIRYAIERQGMEKELRLSEQRFRELAANIKEAVVVLDLESGEAQLLNDVWREIWGLAALEGKAVVAALAGALHPDDRELAGTVAPKLRKGETTDVTVRITRPTGEVRWARARGFPVKDRQGGVRKVINLIEDVTTLREQDERLQLARRAEAVGRLAGGIAHTFNNLLTTIQGQAELLMSAVDGDDGAAARVQAIRAAGDRAAGLTRQLLAFGRGQLLQRRRFSVSELLERSRGALSTLLGPSIALEFDLAPVPPIHADAAQIEHALMTLVSHAREGMPAGGRLRISTARVELDAEHAATHPGGGVGPHVLVSVSDTGAGMDEPTRSRIFDPFADENLPAGRGLELSAVYGVIKQTGGSIWVYSEPGLGTTFKVFLPVAGESSTSDYPDVPASSATPAAARGAETLLIVEDEGHVRELLCDVMRSQGYDILEACDGDSALAIWSSDHPRIRAVISDLTMPGGISGIDVARVVRATRPTLPIILTSGYFSGRDPVADYVEGAIYVPKPYNLKELSGLVRAQLDQSR